MAEVTDISSLMARLNIKNLLELEVTDDQCQEWKGAFSEVRFLIKFSGTLSLCSLSR